MKKLSYKSSISIILLLCIGVLLACGPHWAPRILSYHSSLVEVPKTGIELMFPENKKESNIQMHYENLPRRRKFTFETDIADLLAAAPQLDEKVLQKYIAIRKEMLIRDRFNFQEAPLNEQGWLDEKVIGALPKEFALYHRGAVQYRIGLTEKARDEWKLLLKLPVDERKYRSVWAAWMLARSSSAKGEATQWYNKVLEMTKAGFPDSLNVTHNDWSQYFAYRSGEYTTAILGYISQGREGVIDSMEASRSVQTVFDYASLFERDNFINYYKEFAADKEVAIAFSYYLKSGLDSGSYLAEEFKTENLRKLDLWEKALSLSKRVDKDKEFGIVASIAYDIDALEVMEFCLASMKQPTIDSLWLKAKKEVLEGEYIPATKTYERLTSMIHREGGSPENTLVDNFDVYRQSGETAGQRLFWLYSEYACVELALKRYGKALDLFLKVNNTVDAAYIAETLMSPIELLQHVRASEVARGSKWLTQLLSRKLMRHEYFKNAKPFILDEDLAIYDEYVALYRVGVDEKRSKKERSLALEKAAFLRERNGSSLFKLANRGRPSIKIIPAGRKVHEKYAFMNRYDAEADRLPKMTDDELSRVKKNYIRVSPVSVNIMGAADLLYQAALLLPRNDEHAARLLWQAGDWTRVDPEIADKYYQALVRRCWNTELGKACDKRRWFVKEIKDFK